MDRLCWRNFSRGAFLFITEGREVDAHRLPERRAARRGAVRRDLDRARRRLGATGIEVRTACASTSIIRERRTFSPRVLVFDVPASPRRNTDVLSEASTDLTNVSKIISRGRHEASPRRFTMTISSTSDKTQLVFQNENC